MQYCSLQDRTLLLSPVTLTTGRCFCSCCIPLFFLELFLHWYPVAYWALTRPGEFIFQCPIFLPFHAVHGVLKARIVQWFPFPSPGDHILSIAFCHSVIVVFTLSTLWWIRIRGLWKLPDGRDWLRGKLGLVLMGGAMLSKSLIQFSVDGWGYVPPCSLAGG